MWEAHQDGVQAGAVGESPANEAPSTTTVLNDLRFEEPDETPMNSAVETPGSQEWLFLCKITDSIELVFTGIEACLSFCISELVL